MLKRTFGMVLVAGLLLVGVMAGAAVAAEPDPEFFREYSEIRENASDVGAEFLPDEYEIPGFFDFLIIPLIGLGVVVTAVTLFRYLVNQPRFEREAEERSRR
ncbi:hypothetical protein BH23ACT9_BH23ACT9_24510 [soil metagenome]